MIQVRGRGILWFVALLFVPFAVAVYFLPNDILLQGARTLHVSAALAVILSYVGVAWRAFWKRSFSSGDILAMAILTSFVGNFGFGSISLLWRLGDRPQWLSDSWVTALMISIQTIAAIFYLAAPGAIDGHVPPRNRIVIGAALALGFLIVLAFAAINIDALPLLHMLRPYLDEGVSALSILRA